MKHHRILIKLITKGRLNGSDGLFTIIRFLFISRNNRQSACCCRRNPAAFFDGFHDKKGRLKHCCVSDGLCLHGHVCLQLQILWHLYLRAILLSRNGTFGKANSLASWLGKILMRLFEIANLADIGQVREQHYQKLRR